MIVLPAGSSVTDLVVEPPPLRSPGIHVSDAIKAICVALEPERFSGGGDEELFQFGYTTERMIELAWQARRRETIRPGEIEKDGIVGSPDAITFDDDGMVVDEIKATWMSSTGCPEDRKFAHWIWQIKAYCHMLQTDRARLHVFFVNGNYRDVRRAQFLSWHLLFDARELEENWRMLCSARDTLRKASA